MQSANVAVVDAAHPGEITTQQDALVLIHNDAVYRTVGTPRKFESAIHSTGHFIVDNRDLNLGQFTQRG